MDELLRFREHFPILERVTHLISHSLGAMPRGARKSTRLNSSHLVISYAGSCLKK